MASKISIISNAFVLLGRPPLESVADLTSGNPVNAAASALYDSVYPNLLTTDMWHFARAIKQLSKLTATSPIPRYTDVFQLPGDYLRLIRTFPESLGWDIIEDKLYTNATEMKLDYIYQTPESAFPAYFTQLLTYTMAAHLAMLVTQQSSMAQLWEQKAAEQLNIARSIDGQSIPSPVILRDDIYASRF